MNWRSSRIWKRVDLRETWFGFRAEKFIWLVSFNPVKKLEVVNKDQG